MVNSSEEIIVLASSSTTRRTMLRRAGLEVTSITPNLDESKFKTAAKSQRIPPYSLALQLAEAKAAAVTINYSEDWIIGADQVLACGNVWIDKASSREEARKILEILSGKSHELHTAICVMREAIVQWLYVDTTRLWMRNLSPCFIEGYLDQAGDKVLCSLGCYQFESLGAQLFDRVEGDQFSIQGLPLLPLLDFLRSRELMSK